MKFAILFLAALAAAAPPAVDDEKRVITEKFFPESLSIYTGKYDIVDIFFPFNYINFKDGLNDERPDELIKLDEITIFFVEADIQDNGDYEYNGLYVLKGNKVKKILENGQCTTYAKEKIVYFGAKDGIYKYNYDNQTATKYGDFSESVIKMQTGNTSSVDSDGGHIYFLTEDYVLYRYSEDETNYSKVEAVKDARDIVFDLHGNLFYYDGSNQFYSYNGEKITKISGLPEHPKKVFFTKDAMNYGAVAVIDGVAYKVLVNDEYKVDGTSEKIGIEYRVIPTASAHDINMTWWFAYNKKIYEYNLATLAAVKDIDEVKKFFFGKEE